MTALTDAHATLLRNARRKMETGEHSLGDCFEASANTLLSYAYFAQDDNWLLVHTMVKAPKHSPIRCMRFAHAFLLNEKGFVLDVANGKKICLPKHTYYALGSIDPDAYPYYEYTSSQLLDRLQVDGHYGPWTSDMWEEHMETPVKAGGAWKMFKDSNVALGSNNAGIHSEDSQHK